MIKTERLTLTPNTPSLWSINDHDGSTLGQLGFLHDMFTIELIETAKNLGIATEAACAWLQTQTGQTIQAIQPHDPHSLTFLKQLGFIETDQNMLWQGKLPSPHYLSLNQALGIDTQHLTTSYHPSACQLTECGPDVFNRSAKLTPVAAKAWQSMQQAGNEEGVILQLVSAYRSPKYQAGLIQKKLNHGQNIENILSVNTAPGHSEHHTGRAVDLSTPGFETLEEHFENSAAFDWLQKNALRFNFHLSYPKNNPDGIIYEPWHWCYHEK
ncbi:M15 family metallopeptidase [Marinicella rhabdoformis]|uniref:M15 family metallopeptidase n=1 Tax=Marinicella rhabdoformis TaxID=2580566 RepID=UPI0012AEC9EF|nr:M15 family metallopeptidase [Marinicella rhabdoformis]